MALLAGKTYDPATAATAALSTLTAMTALDTTNLRLTFSAPANGNVLVRQRGNIRGGTSTPMVLCGVLEASTVRARVAPFRPKTGTTATAFQPFEALAVVTGLTPGAALTWDAAVATQVVVASSTIGYGGPDNATANDAWGGYCFEVWETTNLLAGTLYDPGTAVTNKAISTLQAMTAFDTTNLRLTFTTTATGNVLVRMRTLFQGTTGATGAIHLGILDGATVRGRQAIHNTSTQAGSALATDHYVIDASFLVTGLAGNTSFTWDAAWGVETVGTAGYNISYGGPDNATGANAWGGFAYEVWAA
jgi:hypothetical protein